MRSPQDLSLAHEILSDRPALECLHALCAYLKQFMSWTHDDHQTTHSKTNNRNISARDE